MLLSLFRYVLYWISFATDLILLYFKYSLFFFFIPSLRPSESQGLRLLYLYVIFFYTKSLRIIIKITI